MYLKNKNAGLIRRHFTYFGNMKLTDQLRQDMYVSILYVVHNWATVPYLIIIFNK